MWRYPLGPLLHQFLKTISILAGESSSGSDRGIAHFFIATRNTIKGVGGKNKRTIWAWVNSSARRLSCDTLHSLCICRLSLTCSFCEISTSHEECWLILTGLPSLLLDPISCQLVTSLSGIDCPLPLCVSLRQPFLWVPLSNSSTCVPLPTSGRVRDLESKPFFCFRAKTDKGIVCLAHPLHSVTKLPKYNEFIDSKLKSFFYDWRSNLDEKCLKVRQDQ